MFVDHWVLFTMSVVGLGVAVLLVLFIALNRQMVRNAADLQADNTDLHARLEQSNCRSSDLAVRLRKQCDAVSQLTSDNDCLRTDNNCLHVENKGLVGAAGDFRKDWQAQRESFRRSLEISHGERDRLIAERDRVAEALTELYDSIEGVPTITVVETDDLK